MAENEETIPRRGRVRNGHRVQSRRYAFDAPRGVG